MSAAEAEKVAANRARLARFKDKTADLLSEDLTLVSEIQAPAQPVKAPARADDETPMFEGWINTL